MTDETRYSTSDFWLAGALMASGKKFLEIKWHDRKRASFIFSDNKSCENSVKDYWQNNLQVGAKSYADSMRTLKDMVHDN